MCAIVTQLAIENGEPLFQVDYKDPDFENFYFDEYSGRDDEHSFYVLPLKLVCLKV